MLTYLELMSLQVVTRNKKEYQKHKNISSYLKNITKSPNIYQIIFTKEPCNVVKIKTSPYRTSK